jgi:hypothetical protein
VSEHFRLVYKWPVRLLSVHFQPELPVKRFDEPLQGRPRSGVQDRRYQISLFDLTVMAGVAHLGEMRLSGFLLAGHSRTGSASHDPEPL